MSTASPDTSTSTLRLGTRGSMLARTQSGLIANQLERRHPGLQVELVILKTTGDRITDRPLHEFGGKGLFTKELELALLDGSIDFAVHSFKDVPVTMPLVAQENLVIEAVPEREDPRDVAIFRDAAMVFPGHALVGTTSLRRRCQVLEFAPDAVIETLRGNIDTRIRKLREGQFDVILLAMAGLKRAGLYDGSFMRPLEPAEMLPAPGQGALALQCRADDARTRGLLATLHDPSTGRCVQLERAVVQGLNGDCHSPIAALATLEQPGAATPAEHVYLRIAVGGRDGAPPVLRAEGRAEVAAADALVASLLQSLMERGVGRLLSGLE